MQRIKQREKKDKSNYTCSFPKPEVVMSPLHFQGEFTKNVISDYNCSMLQLARDFKLLKHNCKRFPMLLNTVKRLPMLKHNCKRLLLLKHTSKRLLFKQNYKEVCLRLNTWYTISGVHNTNQIQTLLMRCFWWRQHFRNTLFSEPLFFRCFKLPSCWFHCSHLFIQNLML